jgi:dipeptidyl aminopeptidase/acylaminoacyl peptidase
VGRAHLILSLEVPTNSGAETEEYRDIGGTWSVILFLSGLRHTTTVLGAAQPADVWIMDVATHKFRPLTFGPHVDVDLDALVKPELVHFSAHDSLSLSGWLYRPMHPTGAYVLSFHGGSEGQEQPGFRSDYQALLEQGIGLLAPNVVSGLGAAPSRPAWAN